MVAIAPSGVAAGTVVSVSVLACNGTLVVGSTFTFTNTCPPNPTITGIAPSNGPAGTTVTITGTNLADIQEVFFGTIPGGIVSQNGTTLVAISPSGVAAGTVVSLSLLTCNGNFVVGPTFTFTNTCPSTPTITGIAPTSGPAGTTVTIIGTNLTDIQEVFFGTTPGGIVSQNGTTLVVIAPSGVAAGAVVSVSVLACNGTSVVGPSFTFTAEVSNLVCPPRDVQGKQKKSHYGIINLITWKVPNKKCGTERPVAYRIFLDPALTELLAIIPAHFGKNKFAYQDRTARRGRTTYFVVSVDQFGNQSLPVSVTVRPKRKHEHNHSSSRHDCTTLLPMMINSTIISN